MHKTPSITAANNSPHGPTTHRQTLFLAGGRLPKLLPPNRSSVNCEIPGLPSLEKSGQGSTCLNQSPGPGQGTTELGTTPTAGPRQGGRKTPPLPQCASVVRGRAHELSHTGLKQAGAPQREGRAGGGRGGEWRLRLSARDEKAPLNQKCGSAPAVLKQGGRGPEELGQFLCFTIKKVFKYIHQNSFLLKSPHC